MNKLIVFLILCLQWNLYPNNLKNAFVASSLATCQLPDLFSTLDKSTQEDESFVYIKYVDKIINAFVAQMEQELGLICFGKNVQMPVDVECIDLHFVAHHHATMDEACALEVQVTEKFLEAVNENAEIRPYLREYPFTVPRAVISISFCKPNKESFIDGIGLVFQARGYVFYCNRSNNPPT